MAKKRIEGFSTQTLKAYDLQSKLLIRYFQDVEMNSLHAGQLKEYLAKSSEHLKPSSLAHKIRFIKSLFRWSHEEGHILLSKLTIEIVISLIHILIFYIKGLLKSILINSPIVCLISLLYQTSERVSRGHQ